MTIISVAKVPLHLIHRGIIESVDWCKKHKQHLFRFSYCLGRIHQLAEEQRVEAKHAADEAINNLRMQADTRSNQQMLPPVHAEICRGQGVELVEFEKQPPADVVIDSDFWCEFLRSVKSKLSEESFTAWFAELEFLGLDTTERLLWVRAPSQRIRDWCNTNFSSVVDEAFGELKMEGWLIEWKLKTGTIG